ncbi:hypothetical protein NI401_13615 [Acinetobacter indicus]|uniref:hypothetical protein n=1 Tax=Acinetobacter indicus TaxID=756892 RepID=UPI00209A801F|nr:hypothetical protein [Acinetobacter indicus]MCO8103918.1 hypothetical protein [Acinetobacter indicus]
MIELTEKELEYLIDILETDLDDLSGYLDSQNIYEIEQYVLVRDLIKKIKAYKNE